MGDTYLAESIAGDVMVKLWIERERVQIDRSIRQYLVKSVRNLCLDYVKSQYHRHELCASPNLDKALNSHLIEDRTLGYLLEEELESKISEAIAAIPVDSRRVFILSRYHNMTYQAIAKDLGISVNTVKYHIKQALIILRRALDGYLKT